VNPRVDRFLVGSGGGLGTLWFGTSAFILGFAAILGLVKGVWWTAILLVPACVLAYQAWRSFDRGER
jgi:membrane protein implicated in regulation of membrane protease activity